MTGEARRYALDRSVRRSAAGRLLAGGAPARMIRLSAAGAEALDALLAGKPAGPRAEPLLARLLETGIVHPVPGPAAAPPPLTIVVPVRNGGAELSPLIAGLRRLGPVIVVDDGSEDGSLERARASGARAVPNSGAAGPAGARNTGLRLAETELVAFVDADCVSATDWAPRLAALLTEEPQLALVAPRVLAVPGHDAIARYEAAASPLDMGAVPSLVGPGRRVGFLPSAALVGRRAALLAVGGFDEGRRVGEDVDLELRLLLAGWRIRYAPEETVEHRNRGTVAALMRQRFSYGQSAAALDRTHPGAVAPLRANLPALGLWLAIAINPGIAAFALAGIALNASRRGTDADERRALAALALRAQATALPHLSRALVRDWLPLTMLAALASRRARRLALLAVAAELARTAQAASPPRLFWQAGPLKAADSLSYAAGLWNGALRARSAGALLPRLRGPAGS